MRWRGLWTERGLCEVDGIVSGEGEFFKVKRIL